MALELLQNNNIYASVDLGGTNIAVAVGRWDGQILAEGTLPTQGHEGPERVIARIAWLLRDVSSLPLTAVGVGVPGLADRQAGRTLFLPNLPSQWRGVPVAEQLAERLGCPAYLLNDARMAALGELDFGYGREVEDFIFLTLGTGIGGGVVLGGRLHAGPLGAAGELGHMTVEPDGPLCGCGSRGCLETLASATALRAGAIRLLLMGQAPALFALVEGDLNRVSPALLADCGDPAIEALIDRTADYLGIGIANAVLLLHPQAVVLGGGLAQMGERLFSRVRDAVSARARMFPLDGLRIVGSRTGQQAATLGGIALAKRKGLL